MNGCDLYKRSPRTSAGRIACELSNTLHRCLNPTLAHMGFALLIAVMVAGCAPQYPLYGNLHLAGKPQPLVYSDASAFLRGQDGRQQKEIFAYLQAGQPPVRIENMQPPHIVLTERLAEDLQAQGLAFSETAVTRIFLEINELLVTVSRPKLLHLAEARSRITIRVVTETTTLTKNYQREATRETPQRPKVEQLESMLNEQLDEILSQVVNDEDIRRAITGERS